MMGDKDNKPEPTTQAGSTCIGNPPCEDGSCQACQDGHCKPITAAKRDQPGYDSLTDVQKAFYDGYDEGYKAGKETR